MSGIEYLRQFRIGPFAIFDFAGSYLAVYFLAPWISALLLKIGLEVSRAQLMWLMLPISLLIHLLVRTETPLTKMVMDPNGGYAAKIVIVFMVFMAFRR